MSDDPKRHGHKEIILILDIIMKGIGNIAKVTYSLEIYRIGP